MSKGKLAKFADMASYPHVFECPFKAIGAPGSEVSTPLPTREGQGGESESRPVGNLIGRWHEDFFHNQNPIVLELGCGRGEYTVGLARRYPDRNFIGVDIKGARMWTGATESLREGLKNVAFLRTNIEIIDRFFAPGEVQEIWLTFSDPQMKKATKRLTSTYFLQRYRHFLTDGGIIHLKTDSNFLFTYTHYVAERNHLPVEACTEDLYASAPESSKAAGSFDLNIRTYYEQQWLSRGITIKYLRFRLPAEGVLTEPDVEIPLDDYRSYNREKRSSLTTGK
ncbi:MAG: tRNA (guanosine(46)-N7)-methyltransferase TrmB [Bacteroidaceae bacterium]|nr:tRNA (guanosine(46)-N7)-methyltransferase TrmB [Bacteroidaceae bacterium]